jgi:hypothetical protein
MTSEVHPVVKGLAPLILSARAAAQHIFTKTEAQSEDMNVCCGFPGSSVT